MPGQLLLAVGQGDPGLGRRFRQVVGAVDGPQGTQVDVVHLDHRVGAVGGEQEAAPRAQHAPGLGEAPVQVGDVVRGVHAHDAVEGAVREGVELVGAGLDPLARGRHPCQAVLGGGQHRRRDVQASDVAGSQERPQAFQDEAVAAAQVKQFLGSAQSKSLQQVVVQGLRVGSEPVVDLLHDLQRLGVAEVGLGVLRRQDGVLVGDHLVGQPLQIRGAEGLRLGGGRRQSSLRSREFGSAREGGAAAAGRGALRCAPIGGHRKRLAGCCAGAPTSSAEATHEGLSGPPSSK